MADRIAKPFLKWAGGKTQLITEIEKAMPRNYRKDSFIYMETLLFLNEIPNIKILD